MAWRKKGPTSQGQNDACPSQKTAERAGRAQEPSDATSWVLGQDSGCRVGVGHEREPDAEHEVLDEVGRDEWAGAAGAYQRYCHVL